MTHTMTHTLEAMIQTPLTEALGWALVHFLWQGALAALILAAVLPITRSAQIRYLAACLVMIACVGAFAGTLWLQMPEAGSARRRELVTPVATTAEESVSATSGPPFQPADALPWLVPFWFAGVVFFQLRTIAQWTRVRRLRTLGTCTAPEPWQKRLGELSTRVRVSQPVALLESGLAQVPAVMGCLRPAILIPAGLLASMPASHIEAILLHELAHIRRRDYLANLLQGVAEGLLFYHPAIWWISGVIRAERENCCDDIAVISGNGNTYEYATALMALEQSRWGAAELTATAATGGNLVNRVHRLLNPTKPRQIQSSGWVAPLLVMLGVVATLVAAQTPQQETKKSPYTIWMNEDVTYIVSPDERETFLRLKSDEEREHFIVQFWLRRDPTPDTVANENKEEHYRRIGYANSRFGSSVAGWKTDRGRIYIVYGPPDEIESHPSGKGTKPPYEQWIYNYIKDVGTRVIIEFVDANRNGDFNMTTDPNKK